MNEWISISLWKKFLIVVSLLIPHKCRPSFLVIHPLGGSRWCLNACIHATHRKTQPCPRVLTLVGTLLQKWKKKTWESWAFTCYWHWGSVDPHIREVKRAQTQMQTFFPLSHYLFLPFLPLFIFVYFSLSPFLTLHIYIYVHYFSLYICVCVCHFIPALFLIVYM